MIKKYIIQQGELVDDFDNSEDELTDDSENESDEELNQSKKKISSEAKFARRFTQYYDLMGCYFPVLLRLRELAKLSAIAMLLKNTYHALEEAKEQVTVTRTEVQDMLENIRRQIDYPVCTETKVSVILFSNKHAKLRNLYPNLMEDMSSLTSIQIFP